MNFFKCIIRDLEKAAKYLGFKDMDSKELTLSFLVLGMKICVLAAVVKVIVSK